jgi:hypothetical protein
MMMMLLALFFVGLASVASAASCPAPPSTKTTYYVAINEPGASNTLCDGLAPTNLGGGRCPFTDFSAKAVREKLYASAYGFGTKSVTVKVRRGTYGIRPMSLFPRELHQPLLINANGKTAGESVVFTNYGTERVTLDGTCPTSFVECKVPGAPGKIWTMMEIYGDRVIVQGLTFNNAAGRNIQIGATNVHIRCNTFIGPYGLDSDSIKATQQLGPVVISNNEFRGPYEQAIDATLARDWLVEGNKIHEGIKGVGFKFNARNNIIRRNHFYDLKQEAVSLGAAGSTSHVNDYEAQNITAENNIIENVGKAVQINWCFNCRFNNNQVNRARLGVDFGTDEIALKSGCRNGAGCLPTAAAQVFGNRFRNLIGGGDVTLNTFVKGKYPAMVKDFTAGYNAYCKTGGDEVFWFGENTLNFSGWKQATGTDSTSSLACP